MIHDSLPGFNLVDYRPSGFISKYKSKIPCTHPAQIKDADGQLRCLTCGEIVKPEKPAKKKEEKTDKTDEQTAE